MYAIRSYYGRAALNRTEVDTAAASADHLFILTDFLTVVSNGVADFDTLPYRVDRRTVGFDTGHDPAGCRGVIGIAVSYNFV